MNSSRIIALGIGSCLVTCSLAIAACSSTDGGAAPATEAGGSGTATGGSSNGAGGKSGPDASTSAGGATSSGGSPASGGGPNAGGVSATGGSANTADGAAGASGTGGGGGAGTGGGTGAGGTAATSCTWAGGCDDCFSSGKNGACAVLDNPCNDDSSCDPAERTWTHCICNSNGDATAAAACDATFAAANTKAQDIIDCARTNCDVCYRAGGPICKVNDGACSSCATTSCGTPLGACTNDTACKAANSAAQPCVCDAQNGTSGTVAACTDAFSASGQLGKDVVDCVTANCKTECGL